ncbi:MAG: sortase [Oscillospiraceae bacterium]|nr:sortase [Oscillospiraceae bacterium]
MNQILIQEKLYVTRAMKRKAKLSKACFFICIFLFVVLSSYGIYAEYDRNRMAELSRDILAGMEFAEPTTQRRTVTQEPIVVVLNADRQATREVVVQEIEEVIMPHIEKHVARDGTVYYAIGTISIPSLNITYPILSVTTYELLEKSPTRFWGPNPNEIGNLSIAAHNYRNHRFFSRISRLNNGDVIEITDLTGRTLIYEVFDQYIVNRNDVWVVHPREEGTREITLITCTNDSRQRIIVRARVMEE